MNETKIYVVDEPMGRGKSSAAINYINNSSLDKKFLVISPYLEEVTRYKEFCKERHFVEPKFDKGGKTKFQDIQKLIEEGQNIVSTHTLFKKFNIEIAKKIKEHNYTLIMDEVADIITELSISEDDRNILVDSGCIIYDEETQELTWDYEGHSDYKGALIDFKHMCDIGSIYVYGGDTLFWMFPIKVYQSFKEVFIMTYMFDAQVQSYYYKFYNMKYEKMYVSGNSQYEYHFTKEPDENRVHYNYKELITILDKPKLNAIGEGRYDLSLSWYQKNMNKEKMERLRKDTYNFKKNIAKVCGRKFIWTSFKEYSDKVGDRSFVRRFVQCNARATNKFAESEAVAYLVNRYLNPAIKNFFVRRGIQVNEDEYALSEMLQFIWRSRIRKGEPVFLYIPSSRMRNLLNTWISENSL